MIEQKDASKLSDGCHVKNRFNANLLTQKKIGGKQTMGNQGTKNWKLGAFFAVSLMLIAGLFSNAAIAGDGDGMITVEWDEGGSGTASESTSGYCVTPASCRWPLVRWSLPIPSQHGRYVRWNASDSDSKWLDAG